MTRWADVQPLLRWLATQREPTSVLVACREHPGLDEWRAPGADQARVVFRLAGCVADVPPAGLLEVLAGGAPCVTVLLDGCRAPTLAAQVVARADQIASALGRGQQVLAGLAPPSHDAPRSAPAPRWPHRRSTRPQEARVLLLDALAMPVARRALVAGPQHAVATEGEASPGGRLFAVVRALLGDRPIPDELEVVPTGAAQLVAPDCGGSGVCVRVCPTEALSLRVTDLMGSGRRTEATHPVGPQPPYPTEVDPSRQLDQLVLTVDPSRCIDCGLCVESCPEQAMTRRGPLAWGPALTGTEQPVRVALSKRCSRCGAVHRRSGSRCQACEFRASEPFGSRLPPGFTRPERG